MPDSEKTFSPDFQRFREQVKVALILAAADARNLAEKTEPLPVIREGRKNGIGQHHSVLNPRADSK